MNKFRRGTWVEYFAMLPVIVVAGVALGAVAIYRGMKGVGNDRVS